MNRQDIHIGVIGIGPVGLATADRLRREGYRVSLINSTQRVRSSFPAAAAFWTPFASGMTSTQEQQRSHLTLRFYREILQDPGYHSETTGIVNRQIEMRYLRDTCSHVPEWSRFTELNFKKLPNTPFTAFYTGGFSSLIGIFPNNRAEIRTEFKYETPSIQVDTFINWYYNRLINDRGVNSLHATHPFVGPNSPIAPASRQYWTRLIKENGIDHLIVCAGTSAVLSKLVSQDYPETDSFRPLKGVVAHIGIKPSSNCNIVLFEGGFFDTDTLYLVPLVDRYVLGGTVHAVGIEDREDNWLVTSDEKRAIIERAQCFLPRKYIKVLESAGLMGDPLNDSIKWVAGVRPKLINGPVAMESEVLSKFISSPVNDHGPLVFLHYGHGGSGFTMCHDSADQMVRLLNNRLMRYYA